MEQQLGNTTPRDSSDHPIAEMSGWRREVDDEVRSNASTTKSVRVERQQQIDFLIASARETQAQMRDTQVQLRDTQAQMKVLQETIVVLAASPAPSRQGAQLATPTQSPIRNSDESQLIQPSTATYREINHYQPARVAVSTVLGPSAGDQTQREVETKNLFKRKEAIENAVNNSSAKTPLQQAALKSLASEGARLEDSSMEKLEMELAVMKNIIFQQHSLGRKAGGFEAHLGELLRAEEGRESTKKVLRLLPSGLDEIRLEVEGQLRKHTLDVLFILYAYYYEDHGCQAGRMPTGVHNMTPAERLYVQRTVSIMRKQVLQRGPQQRDVEIISYIEAAPSETPKDASKHQQLNFIWQKLEGHEWLQKLARLIAS